MSVSYAAILWNKQKRIYDAILFGFVLIYLGFYIGLSSVLLGEITLETTIIRATATLAILLLHIILMIGPLARLNSNFLPLLYNRRHLGVTMFFISLIHGVFSLLQFHSLGSKNIFVSLFTSNEAYNSFGGFPFQVLGFFALVILFLMAATSHDFWMKNLSPRIWKSLHMMVYLAYALVVMHVMLGIIQLESSPLGYGFLMMGMIALIGLHFASSIKSGKGLEFKSKPGFFYACDVAQIEENRAKIITLNGESIAIFKYDGKLSAINNVCKHQNGPLGEGKIIDGCVTCPWHGYQYEPHNGSSPPPFTEKVATYHLKLEGVKVFVNPDPLPEGTSLAPIHI
ncbi:MAG: sulfoxide reductase heme-binding subunit YedZ [Roseivirga sp.]|jgi:sulfoxide reductase heme-binding subunit YedZ